MTSYPLVSVGLGLTAKWAPSPNHSPRGSGERVRAVVWHIADGSLSGTLDWLRNPRSEASSHLVIGRAAELYQLVDFHRAAWTNGRICRPAMGRAIVRECVNTSGWPNGWVETIECVGFSSHGDGGSLTHSQARMLIAVTAARLIANGLSADREHVLAHSDWDSCTRQHCPGYSDWEWRDWLDQVAAHTLRERGW